MRTIAHHLPDPHIRMVDGAVDGGEIQPEQPVGTGKGRGDHPVELQVGFEFRFIQIMQRAAAFFGIVAPVPWL